MLIGVCRITLRLHGIHSLKAKRSLLQGLLARLRNRFNISVAEIGAQSSWGKAVIGYSALNNSEAVVRGILRDAEIFIEQFPGVEIIDTDITLF